VSILAAAAITALGKILIKAGAPILKHVLETEVGGTAGKVGSVVVDSIGAALGVEPTPEAIVAKHDAEPAAVEAAIQTVEASRDWFNYLMIATAARDKMIEREDTRESFFAWAWRPAMSWLVIFLFVWAMVFVPMANAAFGASIAPPSIEDIVAFASIWLVIYGGGHTAKSIWGSK
jgi:hypothetical protein